MLTVTPRVAPTDLNLERESQGQWKAEPFEFIFSQTAPLFGVELGVVLKQFKLNS